MISVPTGLPEERPYPTCPSGSRELEVLISDAVEAANFRSEQEARAKLRSAAARFSDQPRAHLVYGNFLVNHFSKREGYAEAVREFELAAHSDECTAARFELMRAYNRWAVQSQLEDPKVAIERFTQALKYAVTRAEHVQALTNRAIASRIAHKMFHQKEYLMRALQDSDAAVRVDPSDAIAYMERGLAKLQAGDRVNAESDFKRCLELRPEYAQDLDRFKREISH